MKKAVFFLVLLLTSISSFAQFDTEFWFAPPYANPIHDSQNRFRFVFSTASLASTVTITQPANPAFAPITLSIPANSNQIQLIETAFANMPQSDDISVRGFRIVATEPVFCYYEIASLPSTSTNTEIFSLKGQNALGVEFMIPMQTAVHNRLNPPYFFSTFSVLATEDNTNVTITPTKALVGHAANVPFTITLDQGEFYTARALGGLAAERPAGSLVASDKPVAVTYCDDAMEWGICIDIGGDQIVPIEMLGEVYIPIQGFSYPHTSPTGSPGPHDRVFVLAVEDNTQVFIGASTTPATTLNAGETFTYTFNVNPLTYSDQSAVMITTNGKPIYCTQLSGFGCETGLSILPTMDCRGSRVIAVSRSQAASYFLTIVTASNHIGSFTFNGSSTVITAADFHAVPGTSGTYMFARKLISTTLLPVDGSARIENTTGDFHLGVINGGSTGTCKFGYFSDFAGYQVNASLITPDTICVGDDIEMEVLNSLEGASYTWIHYETGDTLQGPSSVQTFSISGATIENSGIYVIDGHIPGCNMRSDTIKVVVLPNPVADFTAQINCVNNPSIFENLSIGAETYLWNFGDGETSNQIHPTHTFETEGEFEVHLTAISELGCGESTTFQTVVIEPEINIYDTVTLCPNEASYTFYDTILTLPGDYVKVIDGMDCDTVVHLRLDKIEGTLQIVQDPLDFCEHFVTTLTAVSEFQDYEWSTGEDSPSIVVHIPGVYSVTAIQENCSLSTSHRVMPCEIDIYMPNTITPCRKDDLNDYLFLPPVIASQIITFELVIVNRWGEVIYQTTDPEFIWDGKVNGKLICNVTYSYLMRVGFPNSKVKQYKGKIHVL